MDTAAPTNDTSSESNDPKPGKTDAAKSPSKLTDAELLKRIRERFILMETGDHTNREKALEDMKFLHVPGEQWETTVKSARGARPCYEFNKTRIKAKRVVNEMRSNRPAGKVRAVENSDKQTAEIYEGIGRNVLQVSDFDTIADYAGEYQVGAGLGAWRIVTEYGEDSFDQDIGVKGIPNPFNLYWDPASTDMLHRDAEDWILLDDLPNNVYNDKYGDKKRKVNFEEGTAFLDDAHWMKDSTTRVAEYHWKERYEKQLLKLSTGAVIDAESEAGKLALAGQAFDGNKQPITVKDKRVAVCHKVLMCIASGDSILEGPVELKGRYHRFVAFHGEWIIIEGKIRWNGITRFAKDAQRAYNVASTAITETIATAPLSHFWVTDKQARGNSAQWNKAIAENLPFLKYNFDNNVPGPPQRTGGVEIPSALLAEAQVRDQELKDVMGVYDASLGDKSNETSGRAISRRTEQGQIVNFNFPDNMAKAKQWTVTIINDLIPYYYDAERTVRVIGQDGAEDFVKINTAGIDPKTGLPVLANDLTRGKYDVTVTVGPSYATQRQEAADAYTSMAAQDPQLMSVAGDIVYESMDLPGADRIAERKRAMLPPNLQALAQKGVKDTPEMRAAKAQIDQQKQALDQQGKLLEQAHAELQTAQSAAEKSSQQLKVDRANFDADIAKQLAVLAERESELVLLEAKLVAKGAALQPPPGPMKRTVKLDRVNGQLVGEITEEPGDSSNDAEGGEPGAGNEAAPQAATWPGGQPAAPKGNGATPPMTP